MAIAIQAFSVVGLISHIEENYVGGVEALSKTIPNETGLTDDDLWVCSFMVCDDAQRFLERLELTGLNSSQGPDSDLVLVSEFDLSVAPYCEWLEVAQWDKGVIAWRAGTTPRLVRARAGWSPEQGSGLSYLDSSVDDHLELLRIEDHISVYFDKQKGCEVYVSRFEPDPDEVYSLASKVILKHRVDPGDPLLTGEIKTKVCQAIAELETLARQIPTAWRVHFCIGKGKQAIGEMDSAYESLRTAYELEQETESVFREFAGICLELGKADEAVHVGQKAAALQPDNAETLGNLACAYLVAGRLKEAETTINAALKLNADDQINQLVQCKIQEVLTGSRPQPRYLADLLKPIAPADAKKLHPVQKRVTFWSRLQFWKQVR